SRISFITLCYTYYTVFFFFYGSRDHRELHSFPTRRSSDLREMRGAARSGAKPPANCERTRCRSMRPPADRDDARSSPRWPGSRRSEEHTSELQSRGHLVCRLLLEKKKKTSTNHLTRKSQNH